MFFVIFLVLLLVALAVHELSHGWVMKYYSIEVPEAGLGIPIPHLPYFRIKISPTFTFCIHPLLLGAYVTPANDKDIETLPYSAKAHIFGAGSIGNFIMGFILLALSLILGLIFNLELLIWDLMIPLAVSVILPILFWKGSRVFSIYVFPVLGFFLIGFLAWSIMTFGVSKSVMGPVGIVHIGMKFSTFPEILLWGANVSIGLALVNLLPLLPLDGGRTLIALVKEVFGENQAAERIITITGIFILSLLVVIVMYSDISRVLY